MQCFCPIVVRYLRRTCPIIFILTTVITEQKISDLQVRSGAPYRCQHLKVGERNTFTYVAPPLSLRHHHKQTSAPETTFIVSYENFSAESQKAFDYAIRIWQSQLKTSVPIRVKACMVDTLNGNTLGTAWATHLVKDSRFPKPFLWYPIALAEKLLGKNISNPVIPQDTSDIIILLNASRPDWYFGLDGSPPRDKIDFVSVVLHELSHGLGFFGSMQVVNNKGLWGDISTQTRDAFVYDNFSMNASQKRPLLDFPNYSTELAQQLTSNDIVFNGSSARSSNNGTPPKLHAPLNWVNGSSYSHLDEMTFPPGDPNSLMTPILNRAEAIHSPGAVTLGLFDDTGWNLSPIDQKNIIISLKNYPNPFKKSTAIQYHLSRSADVTLTIYDILGRKIITLLNAVNMESGDSNPITWEGRNAQGTPMSSGVYFYQLQADAYYRTEKMILAK